MREITIKNRFTGDIIISGKYESIKDCLEKNRGTDLWGADLRGADLRGADLRGADLWEADLRRADLRGADLWEADLRGADLRRADLWEADLRGANLRRADLDLNDLLKSNSVQTILTIINWGDLSDEMTLEMMRHDAESCGLDKMTAWANGGACPFQNGKRDYMFTEKKELWVEGVSELRGIKLLEALWEEKFGGKK
jgi:Pentapeptide repeats (8 copies)